MAPRPGITDGPRRPPGIDLADIDLASPAFWRRPAGDRLEAFRRLRAHDIAGLLPRARRGFPRPGPARATW